jgi:hypothetical protein
MWHDAHVAQALVRRQHDGYGAFARYLERRARIESGQIVVGEDQLRRKFVQCAQELIAGFHATRGKGDTGPAQGGLNELGVIDRVLQHEDAQLIFHCFYPVFRNHSRPAKIR